jgi:hypothetical protein
LRFPDARAFKHEAGILVAIVALLVTPLASAAKLTGTVKNGTTNKPSAGDDVVLLSLSQGMEEAGRTKTDAQGKFSFDLPDTSSPHLVRAIHQDVTYHRMAPPGTTSVELEVFDVTKKVENLSLTADVLRIQVEQGQLEIIRLFAVNNASSPPRTQMNDHNFEFYLPEGAKIEQSMARTAGGQPLNTAPVPQAEKNRYAFIFPLRPGETQFQVAYQMPYSGSAKLDPKSLYPTEHLVVMLPKSMQFKPGAGSNFQSMQDPQQSDAVVQVAQRTEVGQPMSFEVSGSGILQSEQEGGDGNAGPGGSETATTAPQGRDNRPGGGLGVPIDAPDPMEKYRWYILGGFGVILAGGAYVVLTRQPSPASAVAAVGGMADVDIPAADNSRTAKMTRPPSAPALPITTGGRSSMLLEALKEELFQLEVEHKQGKITQAEYDKAKAALDQTLERAIKRKVKS